MKTASPTRSKPRALRLLCLLLPLALMNCASAQKPAEITIVEQNSGCKVFNQISWEKSDSKPTVQQILAHNRAHASLCKAK